MSEGSINVELQVCTSIMSITMDCEFVETQKGGRALITGGYRYLTIRKGNEGREFWRCCLRSCKAKATTLDDAVEAVRGEHDHAPCPAKNTADSGCGWDEEES